MLRFVERFIIKLYVYSEILVKVVYDRYVLEAEPLGGENRTCEIDESKFGRRKFNRGHRQFGAWVFGIIERESGRVMLIPCPVDMSHPEGSRYIVVLQPLYY